MSKRDIHLERCQRCYDFSLFEEFDEVIVNEYFTKGFGGGLYTNKNNLKSKELKDYVNLYHIEKVTMRMCHKCIEELTDGL